MADARPTIRDGIIHNAVETRRADETRIMQKVNAVNREAFTRRFPHQIEHHMRLISERLQGLLSKPQGFVLDAPDTWPGTSSEILNLTHALQILNQLRQDWLISETE